MSAYLLNKLKEQLTPSRLNRWRYAYLTAEGSRVKPFQFPRYAVPLLTLMACSMLVPFVLFSRNFKKKEQHRIDERKTREGVFLVQMLEWFDSSSSNQNTIELMTNHETMTQFISQYNNTVVSEDDHEEEMIDVERWPTNFEQRHSLYYRNRVRRKLEQLERKLEQMESAQ
jgi:hypothetical protein